MSIKVTFPTKLDETTYPILKASLETMARSIQATTAPEHINNIPTQASGEGEELKFYWDATALRIYTFMNGVRYYVQMVAG